jgi:hypothetical protein
LQRPHPLVWHATRTTEPASRHTTPHDNDATDVTFWLHRRDNQPLIDTDKTINKTHKNVLHQVRIKSVLSAQECQRCLQLAKVYAAKTGRWDRPDTDRHSTYATCDFAIEDSRSLQDYLKDIDFDSRIWQVLSETFHVDKEDMTFLDFFCANYRARTESQPQVMDRLVAHRDGSLLSFTVTLTDPADFDGGGTFFEALKQVLPDASHEGILRKGGVIRPTRSGDAVFHTGKALHGADVVTRGERTVLVGFVHVDYSRQRPGALCQACRDWGRLDVANFRYKRQMVKTANGRHRGWRLNNQQWLPRLAAVTNCCLASDALVKRVDAEYQREKRLEIEDRLLSNILLGRDEDDDAVYEDNYTINKDVTVL